MASIYFLYGYLSKSLVAIRRQPSSVVVAVFRPPVFLCLALTVDSSWQESSACHSKASIVAPMPQINITMHATDIMWPAAAYVINVCNVSWNVFPAYRRKLTEMCVSNDSVFQKHLRITSSTEGTSVPLQLPLKSPR